MPLLVMGLVPDGWYIVMSALSSTLRLRRRVNRHFAFQIVLLSFGLAIGTLFLGAKLDQAVFSTIGLLLLTSFGGLLLITQLPRQLGDPRLQWLGYVWLGKLALTLFLLYAGWIPDLDQISSSSWGYDPQRYYFQAQELVDNNWQIPSTISLNYAGILYYFGAIFTLVGRNPVVPALINTFTTLLATLLMVRVGFEIKTERSRGDWLLGVAIVLPEVLWYDVLTAREGIMMALLTICSLSAGRFLVGRRRLGWDTVAVVGTTALGIGLIRPPMLLPTTLIILLLVLLLRPPQRGRDVLGLFLIGVMAAIQLLTPAFSLRLGLGDFSLAEIPDRILVEDTSELLILYESSQRSIGQLLIPGTLLEAVGTALPRAVLDIVAPIPKLGFTLSGLLQGSWLDWQSLMVTLSALLNIALFPLAIASLIHTVRNRESGRAGFVFHVPYWTLLVSIAAGNYIIHERYRVMAVLLLWGCIWLGAFSPKRLVRQSYLGWFAVLGAGAISYLAYKSFWL